MIMLLLSVYHMSIRVSLMIAVQFAFDAPPTDLVLGRIEGFVMIAAFKSEIGPAQQQGGLSPGMVILQVRYHLLCHHLCLQHH
jgi:hypothetical protein